MDILPDRRAVGNGLTRAPARGSARWPVVALTAEARALTNARLAEQAALLADLPPALWPVAYTRLAIVARELARRLLAVAA